MAANPARSEVWLVDLGLAAKVRPCLVLNGHTDFSFRSLTLRVGAFFKFPNSIRPDSESQAT